MARRKRDASATVRAPPDRKKELERIRRRLVRLHSPRLQMMLIVSLTWAVGFLSSYALLHAGVHSMWLRYPLAVAFAYAAFLFFIWCWLRFDWSETPDVVNAVDPGVLGNVRVPEVPWSGGGGNFGGGGASASFDGGTDVIASVPSESISSGSNAMSDVAGAVGGALDAEEFVVVIIVLVALVSAAGAAVWIVWSAPSLFAELVLDGAIATGLYRRLRGIAGDHWLRTAIKRTVWAFFGIAILFTIAGGAMQAYSPASKTMGQVLKAMTEN